MFGIYRSHIGFGILWYLSTPHFTKYLKYKFIGSNECFWQAKRWRFSKIKIRWEREHHKKLGEEQQSSWSQFDYCWEEYSIVEKLDVTHWGKLQEIDFNLLPKAGWEQEASGRSYKGGRKDEEGSRVLPIYV